MTVPTYLFCKYDSTEVGYWWCWFGLFILLPQTIFQSQEAYFRSIGYREEDEKLESTEDYLKRLESYMKVYGALVQVCLDNLKILTNSHGQYFQFCWLHFFFISLINLLTMLVSTDWNSKHSKFARLARRLGVACKVLEFSASQSIYSCFTQCILASKWCKLFGFWIYGSSMINNSTLFAGGWICSI